MGKRLTLFLLAICLSVILFACDENSSSDTSTTLEDGDYQVVEIPHG